MTTVEQTARSMSRTERVHYLYTRGWQRASSHGTQTWHAPDPLDRGCYTLAAAVRAALAAEVNTDAT